MKKLFKKVVICLTAVFSLAAFSACYKPNTSGQSVLTSFYPVYLITQRITNGTEINVQNMARPQTGCLHDYQLTTLDMRLLSSANVLIINGAGMEHSFIEKAVDETNINVIDSSEGLFDESGINEEHEEHFHSDEDGHDHDHEMNSHLWMSLDMVSVQAQNICSGLKEIYPQYSDIIDKNTQLFINDINSLKELEKANQTGNDFNVISFNEAFHYLLEENGAQITAEIEIDENSTPTARQMAQMSDSAKELNVKAVFCADDNGRIFAETIGRELNIPVYVLDPLTYTVSSDDYISAMKNNILTISEAKNK